MYQNSKSVPAMEEFLAFLGEKITLEGWEGFRGGLDVRSNTTGKKGLYTVYEDRYKVHSHNY